MSDAKLIYADKLIKSNNIYAVDKVISGSVAIKNNKIIFVGDYEKGCQYIGAETEIYNYEDYLVMPGFHDSHVHLLMGALNNASVNLGEAKSEEESVAMVKKFADTRKEDPWVIGFNWYHIYWDHKVLPDKKTLDALIPDRPVFLVNAEAHGVWVNSKGLEMAGIDRNTPCPEAGEIVKDENGEPTGVLLENALGLVSKYAFDLPKKRQVELLEKFNESAIRFGVTSVNDMLPYFGMDVGDLELYDEFTRTNKNSIRINLSPGLNQDLNKLKALKMKYNSEKLRVASTKEFLDGVPTTYTAFLVEPYADQPDSVGSTLIDEAVISRLVEEAHSNDFAVRLHACGDGAVRVGLNCFENAIKKQGYKANLRHSIEHIECIHPDDIKRFKELGVVASMQPEHLVITEKFEDNPYPVRYGADREPYIWAFKDLLDSGAILSFGSDYPVVDINPFPGIYRGVTRLHNDKMPLGGWNPKQKLSMKEVIDAYTYGAAYVSNMEDKIGTIETGKLADLIVLDKNLFEIDPEEIRDTKVLFTMIDGKVAYQK